MNTKTMIRSILLLLCVLCIGAVVNRAETRRRSQCMGIPVSTELSWRDDLQYQYVDYSDSILFNGEKAAIDLESSTIYIPQRLEHVENFWDMEGNLQITAKGCTSYIVLSPAVNDQLKSFSLYVLDGKGHFTHYNVVLSTLPVLRLTGEYGYKDEETWRDVQVGMATLWTPFDADLLRSSTKNSITHWHIRGSSTVDMDKKSWKLSLKKNNGENQNQSFMGLGSDDDWILNSMSLDDTRIKEKLFMALWNELALESSYNIKISSGEYVEAIINGEYCGLYLLQRRIDAKYLDLDSENILMKGINTWVPKSIQEGYEIVSSPFDDETAYSLLESALINQISAEISLENFIDLSLMLDYADAMDNRGYKNMFYALLRQGDNYKLTFIPWDTDMSFGVVWDDGFAYDYERAVRDTFIRQEYDTVLAKYPDLHSRMCSRWQELRQGVLREENILSILSELEREITESGAFDRDRQKWGTFYGGEDTVENLYRFVIERLAVLDERYAA